jgi:hypothetical protein
MFLIFGQKSDTISGELNFDFSIYYDSIDNNALVGPEIVQIRHEIFGRAM